MPCDTIQVDKVELGKLDQKLLVAALEDIGARYVQVSESVVSFQRGGLSYYAIRAGVLEYRGQNIADEIKRSYSRQVVQVAAKRYGWQIKSVSENKFEVTRRF